MDAPAAIPSAELTSDPQSAWGADLQPAGCPTCKQVFLVPPGWQSMRCPHCLAGTLAPQPAWLRKEPPELLLSFAVQPQALPGLLEGFTRGVWLHADDFTPQSLAGRAVPTLWPMWLVDADLDGAWQADTGYTYQVKSSQETYSGAGWQTHERIEDRLRWEKRTGTLRRHYENIASPAVSDHSGLNARIGAYPLKKAVAYSPERLGRTAVRVPDVQPDAAWAPARDAIQRAAAEECRQACGADQVRQFSLRAQYEQLHWTQMLLPMYITYYTADDGRPRRVLVNAQSGAIGGVRLASQKKGWRLAGILAAVAVLVFLIGVVGLALAAVVPPLGALGAVFAGLGLLVGAGALVPAVWPWQWNRGQQEPR